MRSIYRGLTVVLALGAAAVVSACDETAGPLEAEEMLLQAAPSLSPGELLNGLGLEPAQAARAQDRVEALHVSMLELHDLHGGASDLSDAEREEMHAVMAEIHDRHEELMGSLTDAQRERFFENVHAQMTEHGTGDITDDQHDRMRLHLDGHDEAQHEHGGDHGMGGGH